MPHDLSLLFIELGATIVGLAVLARIASHWGFSVIPLYLVAGLAFGNGGFLPMNLSAGFIHVGAEIGVLLLLFMLGLEYTGEELQQSLKTGLAGGMADLLLNFPPGLITGLVLGWNPLAAVLLGGVTYISSSGVIAKLLADLKRMNNPETPAVLSVLVIEDLAMALYLPLIAALLVGGSAMAMATSVSIAVGVVLTVLFIAVRFGTRISDFAAHESDEIILLTTFGAVLLVAGIAQKLQVSAAIGAFLVGIAASGPFAKQSYRLLSPLRDLFAAIFFFFFGLEIDPKTLPPALPLAVGLGLITTATKVLTGYWAVTRMGLDRRAGFRAGAALVPRGEFSIVIAGLGSAIEPSLGPLSAAYVLFLVILGPLVARLAK